MRPYEDYGRHVFLSRSAATSLPFGSLLVDCCRFDTLMRYNTVLIKHSSCCHDFFTHRLREGVHYLVKCSLLLLWSPAPIVLPMWHISLQPECSRQPST